MSNSMAGCPSWCEGPTNPLVHSMELTHSSKPERPGAASASISQNVRGDEKLGAEARFEPLASLWYGGNGAIGDLVAADCRDIATVLTRVADQLDVLSRGRAVLYGEERS